TPRMLVERFDRALSIEEATQIKSDHFFIRKAEVAIGSESLSIDPEALTVEIAHRQIHGNKLSLPVHGRLSKGCCRIILKRHQWAGAFFLLALNSHFSRVEVFLGSSGIDSNYLRCRPMVIDGNRSGRMLVLAARAKVAKPFGVTIGLLSGVEL